MENQVRKHTSVCYEKSHPMDHEIKYVKSITRKYEGFYFKPKGILQQVFATFDKYYLIFEHSFPIKIQKLTIMYTVNGIVSFPIESVKKNVYIGL